MLAEVSTDNNNELKYLQTAIMQRKTIL